jgi:molybdopterin converting factor small subunit
MSVTIRLFGILIEKLGSKDVTMEVTKRQTIRGILLSLEGRIGDIFDPVTGSLRAGFLVAINGRMASVGDMSMLLCPGDRIDLFPPVDGG